MKLRVIHEPWKLEMSYVVQEWTSISFSRSDWTWVSSHQSQEEAEDSARLRLAGPVFICELDNTPSIT